MPIGLNDAVMSPTPTSQKYTSKLTSSLQHAWFISTVSWILNTFFVCKSSTWKHFFLFLCPRWEKGTQLAKVMNRKRNKTVCQPNCNIMRFVIYKHVCEHTLIESLFWSHFHLMQTDVTSVAVTAEEEEPDRVSRLFRSYDNWTCGFVCSHQNWRKKLISPGKQNHPETKSTDCSWNYKVTQSIEKNNNNNTQINKQPNVFWWKIWGRWEWDLTGLQIVLFGFTGLSQWSQFRSNQLFPNVRDGKQKQNRSL